eukprot:maker-scaffold259_size234575-snap-gene-1.17 protein:Tk11169 transcript:maker-scaffold259_size234575-snap-gene-1.17-mRNA-1 annotation:"annexin a13"
MGSGSSKSKPNDAGDKDEAIFKPVQNWEGEVVGWVERTESDKLRRRKLKEPAPPLILNSSDDESKRSSDEEEDIKSNHTISSGSSDGRSNGSNRTRRSSIATESSALDLRSRENSDDSDDSPLIHRRGSLFPKRKQSKHSGKSRKSSRNSSYRRDSRSPSISRNPSRNSRRLDNNLSTGTRSRQSSRSKSQSRKQSHISMASIRRTSKRDRYKPVQNYPKPRPTLRPAKEFNLIIETAALFKACHLLGTDEEEIVTILGKHSSAQRDEIKKTFKQVYKKKDIRHLALIGLMARTSANGLKMLKKKYKAQFEEDILIKIKKETKGEVEKVLIATFSDKKDPSKTIDHKRAQRDAEDLIDGHEDEGQSVFQMLLVNLFEQRNANQMREICEAFRQIQGRELSEFVRDLFGPKDSPPYCAFLEACDDTACFFAGCLHNTFDTVETDDMALIRIIVHRAEIDLKDIAVAYNEMFGRSLADNVREETIILDVDQDDRRQFLHTYPQYLNANLDRLVVGYQWQPWLVGARKAWNCGTRSDLDEDERPNRKVVLKRPWEHSDWFELIVVVKIQPGVRENLVSERHKPYSKEAAMPAVNGNTTELQIHPSEEDMPLSR